MDITRKLRTVFLLMPGVIGMGTVGYRLILDCTWLDALYMTVITLSTVGYGETIPGLQESETARMFTMLLILFGMGILLSCASALTAFFVEGELTNLLRRRKMDKKIAGMNDHIVVCGVGNTGVHVAIELAAIGQDFVVIDNDQGHIDKALESCSFCYIVDDATEESVLLKAGIERARGVVINLASDKDNLFLTFTARQLNSKARIVARGISPKIRERMLRAGANAVVVASQIGGMRMTSELVRPNVVGFLDRMLRPGHASTWRFEEVEVGEAAAATAKTLGALDIQGKLGLPVLAMTGGTANADQVAYYPGPDAALTPGARLVILAEKRQVEALRKLVRGA